MPKTFTSDNEMRKEARKRGLKVKKDRKTLYSDGKWRVSHRFTPLGTMEHDLQAGTRDEVAEFIAAYNPGLERLSIIKVSDRLTQLIPLLDWPAARNPYAVDRRKYVERDLKEWQQALADFEPVKIYTHQEPPPPRSSTSGFLDDYSFLGLGPGSEEWNKALTGIPDWYMSGDLNTLKRIENPGERRRALWEAGRLRAQVDYVLGRWELHKSAEEEAKWIAQEEEAIASLLNPAGKAPNEAQGGIQAAAKRKAKLDERKAKLAELFPNEKPQVTHWGEVTFRALNDLKTVYTNLIDGHYSEATMANLHARMKEISKVAQKLERAAHDQEWREREARLRSEGKPQRLESSE